MGKYGGIYWGRGIRTKLKSIGVAALITIGSALSTHPAHAQETERALVEYMQVVRNIQSSGDSTPLTGITSRAIGNLVKAMEADASRATSQGDFEEALVLIGALQIIAEQLQDHELADTVLVLTRTIGHPDVLARDADAQRLAEEILNISEQQMAEALQTRGFPGLNIEVRLTNVEHDFILYTYRQGTTGFSPPDRPEEMGKFTDENVRTAITRTGVVLSPIEFDFILKDIIKELTRINLFQK